MKPCHYIVSRFYNPRFTLGQLTGPGIPQLYTIERPWLSNRQNKSCIPEGTYFLRRDQEGRYTGYWEVQNVPNRSEIIFCHAGNTVSAVVGCFAVGLDLEFTGRTLINSQKAVDLFLDVTKNLDEMILTVEQWRPDSLNMEVG